jgi:hypothetical protein
MTATATGREFSVNTYVDDNTVSWNMRGDKTWAADGASGGAAAGSHPFWAGKDTKRRHRRYAIFQDTVSGRVTKRIVYTAAALAALTSTSTTTAFFPGLEDAVTMTLVDKVPEKQPSRITTVNQTEPTAAA